MKQLFLIISAVLLVALFFAAFPRGRGPAHDHKGEGVFAQDATPSEPSRFAFKTMGTVGEITTPAPLTDDLVDKLTNLLETIEADLSVFRDGSLVTRINNAAGEPDIFEVRPRYHTLFALMNDLAVDSDGAFDPTVTPGLRLWGFKREPAAFSPYGPRPEQTVVPAAEPSAEKLASVLPLMGWTRVVEYRRRPNSWPAVRLMKKGAALDLGGVAKGYAVDCVVDFLTRRAVTNALVNIGGNIRVLGVPAPGEDAWKVAVRDPALPYGEGSLGTLSLSNGMAVATSGSYEQFVEIGGKRYSHILDPRTARPVENRVQVTVVAPSAAAADALSTACFVLGPDNSAALLERYRATAVFTP